MTSGSWVCLGIRHPASCARAPSLVGATGLTLAITAAVIAGVVTFAPTDEMRTVRGLVGLGADRIDAAPTVPDGSGSYAFMQTQPYSDDPVGYDPCRVIEVEVNSSGAPEGYDELVDTGIAHTAKATGLRFERIGTTDRRPATLASSRRQPVLIAWATPDEVPDLEGDVAGVGGSTAVDVGFRGRRYVTGQIVLDAETFEEFGDREQPAAQAIVDHEFGHLVGLDHVDDPGELMNPENVGRTTYGPGDLEGLARIGGIPC